MVVVRDDHCPLPDPDSVQPREPQDAAREHDPGPVVVLEQEWPLVGAGGDDDLPGAHVDERLALADAEETALIQADCRGAGEVADPRFGLDELGQPRGRIPPAESFDAWIAAQRGRLDPQVPAEIRLVVDEDDRGTGRRRLQCCKAAGGPATDHRDVRVQVPPPLVKFRVT